MVAKATAQTKCTKHSVPEKCKAFPSQFATKHVKHYIRNNDDNDDDDDNRDGDDGGVGDVKMTMIIKTIIIIMPVI